MVASTDVRSVRYQSTTARPRPVSPTRQNSATPPGRGEPRDSTPKSIVKTTIGGTTSTSSVSMVSILRRIQPENEATAMLGRMRQLAVALALALMAPVAHGDTSVTSKGPRHDGGVAPARAARFYGPLLCEKLPRGWNLWEMV